MGVTFEKPGAVSPFARKSRTHPVGKRSRQNANGLCGLGLLADDYKSLRATAFSRRPKTFDFAQGHGVEIEVADQRADIARLLSDNLGAGVLENARSVRPRLGSSPHEVLYGLTDSPYARDALARRAIELHNFGRKRRRIQQKPAFIEHRHTGSSRRARGAGSHGGRNQHTHGGL